MFYEKNVFIFIRINLQYAYIYKDDDLAYS